MNPAQLYQDALDAVSRAVLTGDDKLYLSRMSLPYALTTHRGHFVITDRDEVVAIFQTLSASLREKGVTDYVRITREARYLRPDVIEGLHFTHILCNGERITQPHASRQRLVLQSGEWRFAAAFYGIENDTLPITFPLTGLNRDTPPPGPVPFG